MLPVTSPGVEGVEYRYSVLRCGFLRQVCNRCGGVYTGVGEAGDVALRVGQVWCSGNSRRCKAGKIGVALLRDLAGVGGKEGRQCWLVWRWVDANEM